METTKVARQKQTKAAYHLPVEICCKVIDEWMAKGKSYMWTDTPENVKAAIAAQGNNEQCIGYDDALAILRCAQTSKMRGDANAGMAYIEQEWRRLKQPS
jgi:hypothetical protein